MGVVDEGGGGGRMRAKQVSAEMLQFGGPEGFIAGRPNRIGLQAAVGGKKRKGNLVGLPSLIGGGLAKSVFRTT